MNEYHIKVANGAVTLQYFAESKEQARRFAEQDGHKVKSIRFVKSKDRPTEKQPID